MSNILVTGGAGYIGSHACKALSQTGYTPICYDNLERGHAWAVKWGPLERGDILDRKRLDEVFQKHKPEAVMHFAGYISVRESVTNPDLYYHNNVTGSQTLLEAMLEYGMDKIIFSSSAAIYGEPQHLPIKESHPLYPASPYGENKCEVEKMLQKYDEDHQIRYIALRYFNAAGADPDNEIGESHYPETHLIPLILDVAAGNRSEITIFGDDYNTQDGTCIRDYIHVSDLADAHVLAMNLLEKGSTSKYYNIGTGVGFSVNDVISKAKEITNKEIPVVIGPRRHGDPHILIGSAEKIKNDLCWNPKYQNLDEIIQTAWRWNQVIDQFT